MEENELINLIRMVVRQELAPVMLSILQSNESVQRSTVQKTPSEGPIASLRNIQPYGISSKAPKGTQMMTTPVAFDPSHVLMTGAFDTNKPEMSDGEAILYNAFGQLVYMKNGSIHLGVKTSTENLVLGQVFKTMMATLLTAISAHTHIGNLGTPTGVPINVADFDAIKASPVNDEAVLSHVVFTE